MKIKNGRTSDNVVDLRTDEAAKRRHSSKVLFDQEKRDSSGPLKKRARIKYQDDPNTKAINEFNNDIRGHPDATYDARRPMTEGRPTRFDKNYKPKPSFEYSPRSGYTSQVTPGQWDQKDNLMGSGRATRVTGGKKDRLKESEFSKLLKSVDNYGRKVKGK